MTVGDRAIGDGCITYRLKKLIELLDCIKNEDYQYLQRI